MDAVEVTEDGEVEGMDEAIAKLVARYPWLRDIDDLPDDEPLHPSGRRTNEKKTGTPDGVNLGSRFPALRGRVKAPRLKED